MLDRKKSAYLTVFGDFASNTLGQNKMIFSRGPSTMSLYINRLRNMNESERLQNKMKQRLRMDLKSRKINKLYDFMQNGK